MIWSSVHNCSVYIIHTLYYLSVNAKSISVKTPILSSTTISRSVTEYGRLYMHNHICIMYIKQTLITFSTIVYIHIGTQLPTELSVIQHVVLPVLITSAVIFIIIIMVMTIIIVALIVTRRKTGVHMIMH